MTQGVALFVAAMLLAMLGTPVAAAGLQGMKWGMNVPAVEPLAEAGAKPDYAKLWVGPWTDGEWSSVERRLEGLKDAGVTPVIQWYYWGDDISPECVENGCWSKLHNTRKDKDAWFRLVHELADRLNATMDGEQAIVIVETEFNKNRIVERGYAPTFDAYLERHKEILSRVDGVETVVGFGSWYPQGWERFPRAVEAADYVGMQALRSSVRQSEDAYLRTVDDLVRTADQLNTAFPGKPVFITDLGFSSYPEPEYADHQLAVVEAFFERLPELQARGVEGFMYRSLFDVPMDTANYHGEAERWWGLRHQDGTLKPAYDAWLAGVDATPPEPTRVPATLPAEDMDATAGGRQSDWRASTGAAWNLWSNGYLSERIVVEESGTYAITVHARGSPADGEWSRMDVRLDHRDTLAEWDVDALSYRAYTVNASLDAGEPVTLSVHFTNDGGSGDEDRNLVVDKVELARAGPRPNAPPEARFTWELDALAVSLDATDSRDPDDDALTYRWDFGDGATAEGRFASHEYAAPGAYEVTLTVSDGRSEGSVTREVTVREPEAFAASFNPRNGNEWWIQTDVLANQDLAVVEARVNGGKWHPLNQYSWGWARSIHAPEGSEVRFRATSTDGETVLSNAYPWPAGGATFNPTFAPKNGNEWWVQTLVDSGRELASVEARVEDGDWVPLHEYSWGWARSMRAPAGSQVEFRATAVGGATAVSDAYEWPSGKPEGGGDDFQAAFNPRNGGEWWVQTDVAANRALRAVDARVDGGDWIPLREYSWGWARDMRAPSGSQVEFRATSADGDVVRSTAYAWPQ